MIRKLTYRMLKSDIKILRQILDQAGFTSTDKSDWNLLWVGSAPAPALFQKLGLFQKINHFPGSSEMTRKDRLCVLHKRMLRRHRR